LKGGVNQTGYGNTAMSYQSLYSNTTGYNNAAYGYQALYYNTSGRYNIGIGVQVLVNNSTGHYNTVVGTYAASSTIGSYNTFIGYNSGANNTTGVSVTCIGRVANTSLGGFVNATAIGDNTIVTATDKVRLGSSTVLVVEGQVAYSWPSDGRFKENVKEDVQGLDFIMKLQPVSYNFNRLSFAKHVGEQIEGYEDKLQRLSAIRSVGFIAQDVEKIIQQTGFTSFDAVHAPTNETDNYSMGYAEFVVPLVKAMQEQQKMITDLQNEIKELRKLLQK
jgi:trimeric autotransporter adhesin